MPEMEKTGLVCRLSLPLERRAGLHARRLTPSSSEVNDDDKLIQAGNFSQGPRIQPTGQVSLHGRGWECYLGLPKNGTCVLVACIGCLEAVHGEGTFFIPRTRRVDEPLRKLFDECRADGTWVEGRGADVEKVLDQIRAMGSMEAANAPPSTPAPCCNLVNEDFFRAGNSVLVEKIQILIKELWPKSFRLDCAALGKPPIGLLTCQNSWETFMGQPMEQTARDTCALVACTVAVEAKHRLEYEQLHGKGTFPLQAAEPCDLLIRACFLDGIWAPGEGAYVGVVLTKIQQMGGVPAIINMPAPAPCVLPLHSWQEHRWDDDDSDGGLSPEHVAALMDSHGPCVGVLWVCPWYGYFDAGRDDALVYRGCGRNRDDREQSKELYGKDNVGSHAVVCFAYRFYGEEMHVLVRDNHDAAANGPQRWIDVEELDTLYTLGV